MLLIYLFAFLFVIFLVLGFVFIFPLKGVRRVFQTEAMVVERLGKYHKIVKPGIRVIWPIIDRPREIMVRFPEEQPDGTMVMKTKWKDKIDLRSWSFDFPAQTVITKDNVVIQIDALLIYQIIDPRRAVYEIANLPVVMEGLTQTNLRNVIGGMDLDQTLASRDIINERIKAALDKAVGKWGVIVNLIEIKDIRPPDEIIEAMEKQMRAEREKRATIYIAEGEKKATILEAEGAKEARIHNADGDRRAKIMQAEGEAVARIRGAQAEAEAINKIAAVIPADKGDPTNFLIAIRYIEALKEMVSGKENKVVYLPYEATGILGALGGIKDLLEGMKK